MKRMKRMNDSVIAEISGKNDKPLTPAAGLDEMMLVVENGVEIVPLITPSPFRFLVL